MRKHKYTGLCLLLCLFIIGCINDLPALEDIGHPYQNSIEIQEEIAETAAAITSYPAYTGEAYAVLNNNVPFFTKNDMVSTTYEDYSPLDENGRPGVAMACLGIETMPTDGETRGEIGMIKPAGWHTVKYPDVISDLYLYNRCHLIGWQLSNENDNELNLITGTRYLNVTGMLPFENQTADYIRQTGNHVIYRVTPIYSGDNLLCDGLIMEACSVEDDGLSFCVYCYNIQPGIVIDYTTGNSYQENNVSTTDTESRNSTENHYLLNKNSMKIHTPDCKYADEISAGNKEEYYGNLDELITNGYSPCKQCSPK